MTSSRVILVLLASLLNIVGPFEVHSMSLETNDELRSLFLRDLLDGKSDLSPAEQNSDALREKVEGELDLLHRDSRSYLESIKSALQRFACRIGITRFCLDKAAEQLPADLPDVPPFPADTLKPNAADKLPIAVMGSPPSAESGKPKPPPPPPAPAELPKISHDAQEPKDDGGSSTTTDDKSIKPPASPPKEEPSSKPSTGVVVVGPLPVLQDDVPVPAAEKKA